MSVNIPIHTDPSQTVSALDRIGSAIRKAGQEGHKFSEIDFSHPELKQFSDDAKKLQSNFEELVKVGRGGTAAAVRAGKYSDVFAWNEGHKRQFPNQSERVAHQRDVTNYVAQGTQFAASEKAASQSESGGGLGIPLPGMGGLLKWALGIAGITKATSMISEGVQSAQEEAIGLDTLSRSTNDLASDFDSLKSDVRAVGSGLQLTYNESVKLTRFYAQQSGLSDHSTIAGETRTSIGFARSYGMDPDSTVKSMGHMRWMGAAGDDRKQFAVMLADAINAGSMWAKASEVITAVEDWVKRSESVMVKPPNVSEYLSTQAAMNASGKPGFQGAAGASVLAQIDGGIRQPGFGEAGMNFMWRALSRSDNTDPSSSDNQNLDPFQLRYLLEEGAWGSRKSAFSDVAPELANSDQTNFEAVMSEMNRRYEGRSPLMKADALSNVLNISMHQALGVSDMEPSKFGDLGKTLKEANIDFKDLNMTGLKEMGNISTGSYADLQLMREKLVGDGQLEKFEVGKLQRAENMADLKQGLIEVVARVGRKENEGTKALDAMTQMKDELTKVGDKLLGPLTAIKSSVGDILGAMNKLIDDPVADFASQAAGTGGSGHKLPPTMIPAEHIKGYANSVLPQNNRGDSAYAADFNKGQVERVQVDVKVDLGELKVVDTNNKVIGKKAVPGVNVVVPLPSGG